MQSSVIPDFYYREAAVYPVDWDFLLLTKTFNSFTFRDTEVCQHNKNTMEVMIHILYTFFSLPSPRWKG